MQEYYSQRETYRKIPRGRVIAIKNLLPQKRPLNILDIGCGGGTLGEILKRENDVRVYGTDISKDAISEAIERLDGVWYMDIEKGVTLPAQEEPQHFDVVIFSEVLEHLFYPERAIASVIPLLAQGGVVVITVPNLLFWKNRLRIFLGHFEYEERGLMDRGHIHFFSWKSLRDMAYSEGYVVEKVAHIIPTRGTRWLGRILPGLFAHQFAIRLVRKP